MRKVKYIIKSILFMSIIKLSCVFFQPCIAQQKQQHTFFYGQDKIEEKIRRTIIRENAAHQIDLSNAPYTYYDEKSDDHFNESQSLNHLIQKFEHESPQFLSFFPNDFFVNRKIITYFLEKRNSYKKSK